ncbi:MAG: hypothetical protein Q9213_006066 [Squamulea squamosa]
MDVLFYELGIDTANATCAPFASASNPSGDEWKARLAVKRGHLQFRKAPDHPWESLEWSYDAAVEDSHPEPPNVQEILLSRESINVHQWNCEWQRFADKALLMEPLLGWQLRFPLEGIKEIFCQQRDVPSWIETAAADAKRPISKIIADSIRFQLTGRPEGKDISRYPETVEVAGAGAVEVGRPNADQFPLANLGQDMQPGMEIRLAFDGLHVSTNPKKGPYF